MELNILIDNIVLLLKSDEDILLKNLLIQKKKTYLKQNRINELNSIKITPEEYKLAKQNCYSNMYIFLDKIIPLQKADKAESIYYSYENMCDKCKYSEQLKATFDGSYFASPNYKTQVCNRCLKRLEQFDEYARNNFKQKDIRKQIAYNAIEDKNLTDIIKLKAIVKKLNAKLKEMQTKN